MPTDREACPCCGFLTIHPWIGFEVCRVCFWEFDGRDTADPDVVRGGPNGWMSLTEARANYLRHGAYDRRFVEHVRAPRADERPPT